MIRRKRIRDSGEIKVTFVQPLDEEHGRVFVAGDFNNWEIGSHPLRKRSNGTASGPDPQQRRPLRVPLRYRGWPLVQRRPCG